MKRMRNLAETLIAIFAGLAIVIVIFILVRTIIATFTYNIIINNLENTKDIEEQLNQQNIDINIRDIEKVDNFILITGDNEMLILESSPFYFQNHYKKTISNTFESEDFSQQFDSNVYKYKATYNNGSFSLEKKSFTLNNFFTDVPISFIFWIFFSIKFKRMISNKKK